jgi:diguanylate cyclase (GGDEF)-like protein
LLSSLYVPAAGAALVFLPAGHRLLLWPAVTAMAAYLVAGLVRLQLRVGHVAITQPAFVVALFALPLNLVPIVVPLGVLAGAIVRHRSLRPVNVVLALADSTYCLPPALTLAIWAPGGASWQQWPIYVGAFAAQLAFDLVIFELRVGSLNAGSIRDRAFPTLPVLTDLLLTPIGLAAAIVAPREPGAAAAVIGGMIGLMVLLGREREGRIEQQRLALRDSLTGLANRALFDELLDAAWRRCVRANASGAMLLIDLNRFKSINDGYGHLAGDMALQAFAERLRATVRETDIVARLGGDEFAVLLADAATLDAAGSVADAIGRALMAPLQIPDIGELAVTASIGSAMFNATVTPVEAFLDADRALYACKHAGRHPAGPQPPIPRRVQQSR